MLEQKPAGVVHASNSRDAGHAQGRAALRNLCSKRMCKCSRAPRSRKHGPATARSGASAPATGGARSRRQQCLRGPLTVNNLTAGGRMATVAFLRVPIAAHACTCPPHRPFPRFSATAAAAVAGRTGCDHRAGAIGRLRRVRRVRAGHHRAGRDRGHLRPRRAADRDHHGRQRGLGRRQRPGGAAAAEGRRAARIDPRLRRRAAFGVRQGQPVFPARLQPRPRQRLRHLRRRRADQPAQPRPWAGLPGPQRLHPRGDQPPRLPQGPVSRRRWRLRLTGASEMAPSTGCRTAGSGWRPAATAGAGSRPAAASTMPAAARSP